MFKLKLARPATDADAEGSPDEEIVTRQPPPGHGTARRFRRQALEDQLVQMARDDPAP